MSHAHLVNVFLQEGSLEVGDQLVLVESQSLVDANYDQVNYLTCTTQIYCYMTLLCSCELNICTLMYSLYMKGCVIILISGHIAPDYLKFMNELLNHIYLLL